MTQLGYVVESVDNRGTRSPREQALVHAIYKQLGIVMFFFSGGRRHTRCGRDWSSDVCSSDLPHPEQFVFASNTHELLYRVFSSFAPEQPLRVLSTDSEFHSFSRQIKRLQERPQFELVTIPTEPFASFPERWLQAVTQGSFEEIGRAHV